MYSERGKMRIAIVLARTAIYLTGGQEGTLFPRIRFVCIVRNVALSIGILKAPEFEEKSFTLLHCVTLSFFFFRYGGTQAATFCCLMSLWRQLHFEGGVDVFQMAKLYHYSRPGIWKTQASKELKN